jgi:hypothetical protein
MERMMKVQEVILEAVAGSLKWWAQTPEPRGLPA